MSNAGRNGVGETTSNGTGAAETVTPEVLPPATYPLHGGGLRGVVVPKGILILGAGVALGAVLTLWVQSQFGRRGRD